MEKSTEDTEASTKLVAAGEENAPDAKVDTPKIEIVGATVGEMQPLNGDKIITISDVQHAFVGMGKDELIKYANDPFWVKLRMALFIGFWVIWFGVLFGAVVIIVFAPKCDANPNWYETPTYALKIENIKNPNHPADSGFDDLLEKKDYFQDIGIKALLLRNVLKHSKESPDDVVDYMDVNPQYGSLNSLKNTLEKLKAYDIHAFIQIIPNAASVNHIWFNKSVNSEKPYDSYFVWAPGSPDKPPNNWLSLKNASAWSWNPVRKEYFLHQFGPSSPDWNFRNEKVVEYFSKVFKFWINAGFSGIYLDKVGFLVEDQLLLDEALSTEGGDVGTYASLYHSRTLHLQETYDIIKHWSQVITNSSGILSVDGVSEKFDFDDANIIQRTFVGELFPDRLLKYIKAQLVRKRVSWMFNPTGMNAKAVNGLGTLFMLLPGSTLIESGVEIGLPPNSPLPEFSTDDKAQSAGKESKVNRVSFNNFKAVWKLRTTPSVREPFKEGSTMVQVVNNTILALKRVKEGTHGYIMVFNVANRKSTFNLSFLGKDFKVGPSAKIIILSDTLKQEIPPEAYADFGAKPLSMPPYSYIIFQYDEK